MVSIHFWRLTDSTFVLNSNLAIRVLTNGPAIDAIIAVEAEMRVIHCGLRSIVLIRGMSFQLACQLWFQRLASGTTRRKACRKRST